MCKAQTQAPKMAYARRDKCPPLRSAHSPHAVSAPRAPEAPWDAHVAVSSLGQPRFCRIFSSAYGQPGFPLAARTTEKSFRYFEIS